MPRNSDFEYTGLKVEHAGGFNAQDYHNRVLMGKDEKPERQGPSDMKGVFRPPSRKDFH